VSRESPQLGAPTLIGRKFRGHEAARLVDEPQNSKASAQPFFLAGAHVAVTHAIRADRDVAEHLFFDCGARAAKIGRGGT
jgi:hypothetical protein